jgi:hypothetical protein
VVVEEVDDDDVDDDDVDFETDPEALSSIPAVNAATPINIRIDSPMILRFLILRLRSFLRFSLSSSSLSKLKVLLSKSY